MHHRGAEGAEKLLAVRNLWLTAELLRVMAGFQAEGIPALSFKGPVLEAMLYGERTVREYSDVDVLVHKEDVARALGVLGELGFEAGDGVEQWFFEGGRERPLVRKSTGAVVDLHWGLMPRSFAGDLGGEGIWERCARVRIGKREIPTLGDEDLVHFLCVHGTKHQWESSQWVRDVAGVVRARPGIDWDAVMQEARRTGTRRAVLLGLHLAHELEGADVPGELLAAARLDRVVRAAPGAWGGMVYSWRVSARGRARWRAVRGSIFEATPADRMAYKMPRVMWGLYPVIRPLRLVLKYAGRIGR